MAVKTLELRQHRQVTGMLVVSGAKMGCVLQVTLGFTYPREIKLRRRDIAGERQTLAGRILPRYLPSQQLDLRPICAVGVQGNAQSMTPRIAGDPSFAAISLRPRALERVVAIGCDPGNAGHDYNFTFYFNNTPGRPLPTAGWIIVHVLFLIKSSKTIFQ